MLAFAAKGTIERIFAVGFVGIGHVSPLGSQILLFWADYVSFQPRTMAKVKNKNQTAALFQHQYIEENIEIAPVNLLYPSKI